MEEDVLAVTHQCILMVQRDNSDFFMCCTLYGKFKNLFISACLIKKILIYFSKIALFLNAPNLTATN